MIPVRRQLRDTVTVPMNADAGIVDVHARIVGDEPGSTCR